LAFRARRLNLACIRSLPGGDKQGFKERGGALTHS
jgi:hypothetical protein